VPAGAGENILIDDNFCQPAQRGIFIWPATWRLDGSTMTLWQADRTSGSTLRQFDVVVATRAGKRTLYPEVYRLVDAVTWRSSSTSEVIDAASASVSRRTIAVDLRFAAPLPARGEGTCTAAVTLTVDGVTSAPPTTSCEYGAVGDLQQLRLSLDSSGLSRAAQSALLQFHSPWMVLDPADPTYLTKGGWPGLDGPPSRLSP
jgi:hypothetical protein